jgi:hypothetical protein
MSPFLPCTQHTQHTQIPVEKIVTKHVDVPIEKIVERVVEKIVEVSSSSSSSIGNRRDFVEKIFEVCL